MTADSNTDGGNTFGSSRLGKEVNLVWEYWKSFRFCLGSIQYNPAYIFILSRVRFSYSACLQASDRFCRSKTKVIFPYFRLYKVRIDTMGWLVLRVGYSIVGDFTRDVTNCDATLNLFYEFLLLESSTVPTALNNLYRTLKRKALNLFTPVNKGDIRATTHSSQE